MQPDFENIEILDFNGNLLLQGNSLIIQLNPGEERIIKIRTCPIFDKKAFKNVQPIIKTKGFKPITYE